MPAAIAPITGMLRRGLVLDLSVAFENELGSTWRDQRILAKPTSAYRMRHILESGIERPVEGIRAWKKRLTNQHSPPTGFGTTFGYLWWYGFHLPRVRERDVYYARLEADRAAGRV
ncbi:hypothetical protein N7466_005672 [Penicillium verhagenii]|uniref:uncharacterized protein n=1 Tax=Penicillium verhagenii TaxID=1562060 RepID=UPI00254545AD|nr:uncharacterized protein N7466_005672 [Penicillium verhagenii]KAJ5930179.1 hypothetical protein N7466_005672 [Penicillium verhagenii]